VSILRNHHIDCAVSNVVSDSGHNNDVLHAEYTAWMALQLVTATVAAVCCSDDGTVYLSHYYWYTAWMCVCLYRQLPENERSSSELWWLCIQETWHNQVFIVMCLN